MLGLDSDVNNMSKFGITVLVIIILAIVYFAFFHTRHLVYTRQQTHAPPESVTGIGVALLVNHGELKIMDVLPNTPAAHAGLHRGLIIQQINGTNIAGMPLATCAAMTRGPLGSPVQLEILDPANNETSIVDFTREKIALPVGNRQMKAKPVAQ